MNFLKSLLAGLVDNWAGKAFNWLKELFNKEVKKFIKKQRIEKENDLITEQQKQVNGAVNIIKKKQSNGTEITKEDIKRLKDASRQLNNGFFH